MFRPLRITACIGLVLLAASPLQAQFYRGFTPAYVPTPWYGLHPVTPVHPLPAVGFNPLRINPWNPRYMGVTTYYGLNRNYSAAPARYALPPTPSSYSSAAAARDFSRAQEAASHPYTQTPVVNPPMNPPAKPPVDIKKFDTDAAVARAINAKDETEIASGRTLNALLGAATTLDRGEQVKSDFLTPEVMAAVRFTGSPEADLLNVVQEGDRVAFPEAFTAGKLADSKAALEKDFAAAIAPVMAGKPAEPAKAAKLEATLKEARANLDITTRDLDFDQATAAKRFLNRLSAAAAALKKPGAAAVFVPKWRTEGATIAELARHMAKLKLQFAPAAKGDEAAYTALHRALTDHLFALLERNGGAKQPK